MQLSRSSALRLGQGLRQTAQEGAQNKAGEAIDVVGAVLNPADKVAAAINKLGVEMAANTYNTLRHLQDMLRAMMDAYSRNCCK